MKREPKTLSPLMRVVRVVWACGIAIALVFSILMAAWGDLREGLMLKLLDDRYVKSFTVQAPQGAKIWVGSEYLGASEPHSLAEGEDENTALSVEGMSVMLPRVYLYEPQLLEQSVTYQPTDATEALLARLAPGTKLLWTERETVGEAGFVQALLKHDDGRLDFVNLARVDWPGERRVCLMRLESEAGHVFSLMRQELWTDQLSAPEGGFWPQRAEYEGYPPHLRGQCKTVWRWYLQTHNESAWLKQHAPGETDVKWFKLAEES